ncbi:MAG TPA: hypothetical protein VI456_02570 [Polyangia bacterium]
MAPGLLLGCAHSTYRAPAPTVANEGVALSVLSGQRCFVTREDERMPPPANDNRVHVRVTVQIENDSPGPVDVASENVRLTPHAAGSGTRAEMAPLGASELTVPSGESRVLPLDFAGPGPVDCRQPFDLDTRDALVMADQPIPLAPVRLAVTR